MSILPTRGLSPEQQQRLVQQIYGLLDRQTQSYRKHRKLGQSSSISMELAKELMESLLYTMETAACLGAVPPETALLTGQAILEKKHREAGRLLKLVTATAPRWQSKCRWEALRYLEQYLKHYDLQHMAHRGPHELFYPTPVPMPEEQKGIHGALQVLTLLWQENQIMTGPEEQLIEALWDRLPTACLNQCEQLLQNGLAKCLLEEAPQSLVFDREDRRKLYLLWEQTPEQERAALLEQGAHRFCRWVSLRDPGAAAYVRGFLPALQARLSGPLESYYQIFL